MSPRGCEDEAENVTSWLAPAATLTGDCGDEVTPAGNPVMATVTGAENLFSGRTEMTAGGLGVPIAARSVGGLTAKVKSGLGGGTEPFSALPPQPTNSQTSKNHAAKTAHLEAMAAPDPGEPHNDG